MWSLTNIQRDRLWGEVTDLFGRRALARVGGMLDLLAEGRSSFYGVGPQKVRNLWLPDLATRPFYERGEVGWVAGLESRTPGVLRDLRAVMVHYDSFRPYLDSPEEQGNPHHNASGLTSPERGWKAFSFCRDGRWISGSLERCPNVARALEGIPLGAGDVMFSCLERRSEIPAHYGLDNLTLTCHLGLSAPGECGLVVDRQRRAWSEGRCLLFDDTFLHSAWNRASRERVVLLFDFWHPGLTRTEVSALRYLLPRIKAANRPQPTTADDARSPQTRPLRASL